jgi:uncharacterized membrane protein
MTTPKTNNNIKINTKDRSKSKKNSITLRKIFLPIFTTIIIIITYFYISEWLGSISTKFTTEARFSLDFSLSLLIFVFFSFLVGPYLGGITGFLGELLYQFIYYDYIHLEWCIIIAVLGILSGLYHYKPLQYKDGFKILNPILILIGISTLISLLIVLFKVILTSTIPLTSIFIDYGLKFFLQAFFSVVFIVPVLLLGYDRGLAKEERFIYNLFLTHHPIYESDHTFYFKFGRTFIFFCSRCSGVIIGGLIMSFLFDIFEKSFSFTISPELAVILCILLPIPGIIDWGTQTLGYRKSTTASRLFTGFIIGSALYLLSFTRKYYLFMIIITVIYFMIVGLLMFIGNKKDAEKEQNQENSNHFSELNING